MQKDDALKVLEEVKTSHQIAKEAVAQGDGTLKEAQETYKLLSGFQAKVADSSASADLALQTVPGIEKQIAETEESVHNTNAVS